MGNQASTQSSSSLSRLALEIRQQIFDEVLESELQARAHELSPGDYMWKLPSPGYLSGEDDHLSGIILNVGAGLFLACKNTNREIHQVIFLRHNLAKPTCRLDVHVADRDVIRTARVLVTPIQRPQHHNVKLCLLYSEDLKPEEYEDIHPGYLLALFVTKFPCHGPALRPTRPKSREISKVDLVEVNIFCKAGVCVHDESFYRRLREMARDRSYVQRIGSIRVCSTSYCSTKSMAIEMGRRAQKPLPDWV